MTSTQSRIEAHMTPVILAKMDISSRKSRQRRKRNYHTGHTARHVDANSHGHAENGGTEIDGTMPPRSARDKRAQSRLQNGGDRSKLSALEEEFIYAAEFGDIPTAQRILEDNTNFSVDYSDILGRTPLRLAVGNEHLEVVELLLDRCNISSIHEALLQAISAGHEQIAETILKHPKYRDAKKENKRIGETDYFFNTTSEDSPFSSDITPLILAAERNQFEIVQLLLLRGETIQKPHHYYCACQECSNKLQFDQLRLAKTRLNAYKGLSSGAYISLSSKDPVLTAFELARELRRVARVEKYFKNDYLALADQLSDYVVKLLDKVRGHDELEILLDKTGKSSDTNSYERLARLKLAIHYNEKKFVSHPSCQQKLVSIWYSDLRVLERSNWFLRAFIVFLLGIVYPVMAVLYWIAPRTVIGKFLRSPCIKFIGHTVSFLTFIVMIIISTVQEKTEATERKLSKFQPTHSVYRQCKNGTLSPCDRKTSLYLQVLEDDWVVRNNEPVIINILLSIWIVGMLWQELKQVYNEGLYGYFDSLYNYLDCAVLLLYISSFTLRYLSMIKSQLSIEYFERPESWKALANDDPEAGTMMYWLIADRYLWHGWDPHLIGEGLFAVANVISFTKISYLLPANELSGPMQISLARMLTDIMKFAIIFLVIFGAFMVGLQNLYWYYPLDVRENVELHFNGQKRNVSTNAEKSFGYLEETFQTVFWSLFGRGEYSVVELGDYNHTFTENAGYCIFGAYNITTVIVLLNMLIAMMSRSFELIQSEADTEWKFARTKLYMEYINDDCTLPVPFNIIPTPKSIVYIFQFIWRTIKPPEPEIRAHPGRIKDIELYIGSSSGASRRGGRATNSDRRAWDDLEHESSVNKGIKHFQQTMSTTNGFVRTDSDPGNFPQKLTYQRVMKRIVKRYIFDMQRESDVNEGLGSYFGSSSGDFDEIKQDISSFRYEMLNHLNGSQRETKINSTKLEALERKLERVMEHQMLLLKHLNVQTPAHAQTPVKSQEQPLKSSFKKHQRTDSQVSPESAIFDYIDEEPGERPAEIARGSSVRIATQHDNADASSEDSAVRDDTALSDDGSVSHVDAQVQVEYPSASDPSA